ncbi:small acid-soluble spore protein O [Bacillus suaedae]|uniref:Small acid-soluble spore protein O n=1 Tax=Halalkalibacter suaedae TaxID=2822140 RepID=A0A941ARM5_9BACI|nr:small acid-soluble spore protein O [Bacillus suaedae]MBP3952903.1 small acid-soluble spore protein O [Bacillus suaedae]
MAKKKSNHEVTHMTDSNAQAKSAGINSGFMEEAAGEPLTEMQRQNNKKTKKRQ